MTRAALGAVLVLAAAAPAQDARVTVTAVTATPATVAPGAEFVLEIKGTIELGYHVYGKANAVEPTRLVLGELPGLEPVGEPEVPAGAAHVSFGDTHWWIEDELTVRQRFKVTDAAFNGRLDVRADLAYMACTPEFCDPPHVEPIATQVTVEGGQDRPWTGVLHKDRVRFRAHLEPAVLRPGERSRLVVEVECDDRWHVYGSGDVENTPTELRGVEARDTFPVGPAEVPFGEEHSGPAGEMFIIEGEFAVTQPVAVVPKAEAGARKLKGSFAYQTCDEGGCLAPTQKPFEVDFVVQGGPVHADYAATADELETAKAAAAKAAASAGNGGGSEGTGTGNGGERSDGTAGAAAAASGPTGYVGAGPFPLQPKFEAVEDDMGGGLWSLILLCIGGGLIALIMPCTYPMIPITFSFFTKQAERRGGNVLPLALTYGAGIVGIFIVIGLAVGPVIIEFAAHWATNLVIGLAFLVFAFALFGWINLQPPAFLTRASGKASAKGGLAGVFLMGATLVVTSFTCTAPIVGSLLAAGAKGDMGKLDLAIGMAAFGATMATPFVFLALLPGRVKALPKSGEWMHTLKVSLGFIELAAALKFLSNFEFVLDLKALPRELFLGIWALVFALLALFLFGLFRGRGEPVTGVSRTSNGFGVAALVFSAYCMAGVSGLPLGQIMTAFEPPYQVRAVEEHVIVEDDHALAVERALEEKKYLLVNITGFS